MLSYALMLGLSGEVAEAHAWLQRAQMRMGDEPEPRAEDLATLDLLRLFTFTVTGGAGDEVDAGRRAVEAVEAGLNLGVGGGRARMNLVRGYLLVDDPGEAGAALRTGSLGDELATLVLAPALAARIALREGRVSEAVRQATAALQAAHTFGVGTHLGSVDAHLALAGALIDRNELADANTEFQLLDDIIQANPFAVATRSCSGSRRSGWLRRWTISTRCSPPCARLASSSTRFRSPPCDAWSMRLPARWHLEAGQTRQAEELIATLADSSPAHTLLHARLDLARGRFDAVPARLRGGLPTIVTG